MRDQFLWESGKIIDKFYKKSYAPKDLKEVCDILNRLNNRKQDLRIMCSKEHMENRHKCKKYVENRVRSLKKIYAPEYERLNRLGDLYLLAKRELEDEKHENDFLKSQKRRILQIIFSKDNIKSAKEEIINENLIDLDIEDIGYILEKRKDIVDEIRNEMVKKNNWKKIENHLTIEKDKEI